jgi:hypothetical protein
MLVERAFWEAVNGFDEGSFPAVTAEHDLCIAAWASGRRVLTVPAARSVHDTGAMLAPAAGWIGSTAFRNFLIARNLGRLAERWAAFLADRCPAPAEIPDTDAVKGELARIAAADSVVLPSDRWPDRSRLITAEGTGGMDAPPEIERHAQALLDDRRNEFADWAARQIDQLYEQRTNSAEYAASLRDALAAAGEREAAAGERAAAAHERIESISVALSESEAALAARDATMTWRLRSRVTSIPGVASVWRALRGRSADR